MDLEKMSVEELRDIACGTRIYWLNAFDELVRRLALKDADLLLERDRAEKAESQVAEAQKLHELDERIIRVSADAAELQNNKLEKAEKELSEANICEQCDGNTEGVHFCVTCWNNLATQMLKAEAQVNMLVEALTEPMKRINNIKKNSTGEPSVWNVIRITGDEIKVLQEALAKIKEEA